MFRDDGLVYLLADQLAPPMRVPIRYARIFAGIGTWRSPSVHACPVMPALLLQERRQEKPIVRTVHPL